MAVALGHWPGGWEGRSGPEPGPSGAELQGDMVGASRVEAGARAGAEGGTRTRAGREAAGIPGEPWRQGQQAGRSPLPLAP